MTGKSPRSPPMQDAGVSVAKATATPSGKVGSPARIDGQAPHPQAALDRAARANLARMTAGISPHAVVDARNDLAMHPRCALLFPSFAVERAQELISDLGRLMAEGSLPVIPVHVDCPLATKATHVFAEHHKALEAGAVLMKGLRSRHPRYSEKLQQSMALDRLRRFHIVIAASGMCEAGRIRHRPRKRIWRDEATVPFTGHQAVGTLDSILQERAPCDC